MSTLPNLNAFVYLCTSDSYLPGVLTSLHSLQDLEGTLPQNQYETVCLVTPETVSVQVIKALRKAFSLVVGVEAIRSTSLENLNLLGRPDLSTALTKIHIWRLVQFRKIIYLDSDTLILKPLAHLFDLSHDFSAAPDQGWPDCFNTGLMVFTPNANTFDELLDRVTTQGSWDGADQGLLNDHFENRWHRLPFAYNVTPSAYYQFPAAYARHGQSVSMVHFIGAQKPWDRLHRSRPESLPNETLDQEAKFDYHGLLNRWFDVFEKHFGQLSTAAIINPILSTSSTMSAFVVPTLAAAWDAPKAIAYRPPSPEQLKTMFGGGATLLGTALASTAGKEGLYASMPLTGRPDLLSSLQPPSWPLPSSAPFSAPVVTWNPAVSGPPKNDQFQMKESLNAHYENLWDEPLSATTRSFFEAPTAYGDVPSSNVSDYKAITGAGPPNPASLKPVFPWEESSVKPSRRFPDSPTQPTNHSESAAEESTGHRPPPIFVPHAGFPAEFAYSNAWDAIQGIRRYADNLSGPRSTLKVYSPTGADAAGGGGGRKSSITAPETDLQELRRQNRYEQGSEASSRDGDDEDDESDEVRREESPSGDKSSTRKKTSAPVLPRKQTTRPFLRRNDESLGSHSRLPTLDNQALVVDLKTAVDPQPATRANDVRTSLTSDTFNTKVPVPMSTHPTLPTATRVFDPRTDTGVIRKEGLDALNRFVRSMEAKGANGALNGTV